MAAVAISACLSTAAAAADTYDIRMITDPSADHYSFVPDVIHVSVGDKVRFIAENRMQSSRSIPGMLPSGASRWNGPLGHSLTITFVEPGIYGFKCPAYYRMGMVGLVIVGDRPSNLSEARSIRHPDAAALRFERLFETAACLARGGDMASCAPAQ